MDTTGFSQIGRYGTLSLVKRATGKSAYGGTNTGNPNQIITSFGVDNASLTFGRNLTCDVRLYYPEVEGVHARVVWEDEDEKNRPTATLHVLGESGVYVLGPGGAGKGKVEGKWVYPRYPDEDDDENKHEVEEDQGPPQPTIVELPNNAEFEIAHKRFRVTYPPRGVRARDGGVLGTPAGGPMLNTPIANKPGQQRRALRLSMIHSAQVFSPRPSADPRENLRVLQSPLKVPATPLRNIFGGAGASPASPTKARSRSVSPLKFGHASADMGANEGEKLEEEQPEDQEVILVHTNHPRVVEEDKDLVILEDVPLPLVIGSSSSSPITGAFAVPVQPQPQQAQLAPPVTPKRKSLGGTALHRAVLIRSAQRAVWKAERERMEEEEEREEEMEVLDSVVDERASDEEDEDEDVEMRSVSDDDSDDGENEDKQQKPLWRKSLEKIIPWRFSSKEVEDEKEEIQEERHEQDEEHNVNEEEDEKDIVLALQERTPARRALGSFMTPQHPSSTFETHRKIPGAMGPPPQPPQGRHSLGGGEARRVIAQQPWRVKDLVVPPPSATSTASSTPSTFAQPPNIFPTYPPAAPQLQPRTPIRSVPVLGVRPGVTPRPFPGVATPGLLPQRVAAGSTPLPPPATPRTPAVSAEERRAIQERRRSAVKEAFVLGSGASSAASEGVPGMSPSKSSPSKPMGAMRIGAFEGGAATPRRSLFPAGSTSPTKGRPLGYAIPEHGPESSFRRVSSEGDDDEVSTDEMLERMRETVESMKRRRSLALGVGSVASTPVRATSAGEAPATGGLRMSLSPKKLDFSHFGQGFTTPESEMVAEGKTEDPMGMDLDEEAESAVAPPPVPSLLRTPARPTEVPVVRVEVVESVDDEEAEPAPTTTKAKPKARLLRAPAPEAPKEEDPIVEVEDHVEEVPVPATRSSVKPPSRSRTTARSRSRSPLPPAPPPVARSSSRTPVTPTEEVNDATLAVPAPKTRSARSRSRTPQPPQAQPEKVEYHPTDAAVDEEVEAEAEPVEEEEAEEEAKPVKKATRARGGASNKTKPTAAPTAVVAAPPRARSRSRAPVPVPVVDDEPEPDHKPEPQVTKIVKPKATRGRPKKATTAAPSEDEIDDDELGTYQMVTPAPSAPAKAKASTTKKTTTTTKTPAAAVKPPSKIASGSRSTGSKRTRTPVHVKQEEEAEPAPAPVAKRSSSKANIKTTKAPASTAAEEEIQAKPAPAKRGRPRKNDAALTPVPSVPMNQEEEKENTPGPSASDEAEEQQQAVKVRVSRRGGTAAKTTTKASSSATKTKAGSKLKVPKEEEDVDEQEEEEEVAERKATTGTRTTRIMRMRTRTG